MKSEFNRASISAALGVWIGFIVGPNAMIAATNSNFLNVLPDALHTSRTSIAFVFAMALWLNAAMVPFAGKAMDRFGVRQVILPGILIFALAFFLLSRMSVLWHFVLLQALLTLGATLTSSVGYAKVIAMWFDRHRGFVLGLCVALGAGAAQTVMPKVSSWLITDHGWRGGYMGLSAIVLCLGFPLVYLLVRAPRDHASSVASLDAGGNPEGMERVPELLGVTRGQALRQPVFYLVFFAIMCGSMALLGTMQHVVPMLLERGLTLGTATTIMSCAFAGVVAGEFSSGFLVDRFNTPRVILPYFVCAAIGVMAVHTQNDMFLLLPGAFLMGLGLGGEVGQNAYLVSRYFGLKAFGAIYGMTFAASAVGNGTGLILLGVIRDQTGSYEMGRYLVGAAIAVSILCIASLKPFVYASRRDH
ncbi:MAG: MFS transporter [Sphingobium sp.]